MIILKVVVQFKYYYYSYYTGLMASFLGEPT